MSLPTDVLQYLSQYIDNDNDKYHFIVTCKNFMLAPILFIREYRCSAILKSSLYHNFTNVRVDYPNSIGKIKCFPKNIKRLNIDRFMEEIWGMIPQIVTHLIFDKHSECIFADKIPSSVIYLDLGGKFVKNIPSAVKYLTLRHRQEHVDTIPSSVTHLLIGYMKNDSVPSFITHLKIESFEWRDYFKAKPGCIPTSVTHLVFGDHFNKNIDGLIPSSVTHLTFGKNFCKSIRNIPSSITHLILGEHFQCMINIPFSVTHLTLENYRGSLTNLPSSVTHLVIHENYSREIPTTVKFISHERLPMYDESLREFEVEIPNLINDSGSSFEDDY